MTIRFLGTNGWFDTKTGVTPCILIESQSAYIVLDAGNGIYKLDQYIKSETKPIYLFLTHLHWDHIFGLHTLNKFKFPQGMKIFVPKGMLAPLRSVLCQPFTVAPEQLSMKTEFVEVTEGENSVPFTFACFSMFHWSPNFGYRMTIEDKIISYSGDTGICDNSMPLAKNADVLIHECSFEPGHPASTGGHVNPEEAATLAKQAHVARLLLTHFDARTYTTLAMRKKAEQVAQAIFPSTACMVDDQVVEIK